MAVRVTVNIKGRDHAVLIDRTEPLSKDLVDALGLVNTNISKMSQRQIISELFGGEASMLKLFGYVPGKPIRYVADSMVGFAVKIFLALGFRASGKSTVVEGALGLGDSMASKLWSEEYTAAGEEATTGDSGSVPAPPPPPPTKVMAASADGEPPKIDPQMFQRLPQGFFPRPAAGSYREDAVVRVLSFINGQIIGEQKIPEGQELADAFNSMKTGKVIMNFDFGKDISRFLKSVEAVTLQDFIVAVMHLMLKTSVEKGPREGDPNIYKVILTFEETDFEFRAESTRVRRAMGTWASTHYRDFCEFMREIGRADSQGRPYIAQAFGCRETYFSGEARDRLMTETILAAGGDISKFQTPEEVENTYRILKHNAKFTQAANNEAKAQLIPDPALRDRMVQAMQEAKAAAQQNKEMDFDQILDNFVQRTLAAKMARYANPEGERN